MSTSRSIKNSSLSHTHSYHLPVSVHYVPALPILTHIQLEPTQSPHRALSNIELDRIVEPVRHPKLRLDTSYSSSRTPFHRSQGLEILWPDSLKRPAEEEYIGMVKSSTFLPLFLLSFKQ